MDHHHQIPEIPSPPEPPNGYRCRKVLLTTINVLFILVVVLLILLNIFYPLPLGRNTLETVFLYIALWLSLPLNIVGIVGVHCTSVTCLAVYFAVHAVATAIETIYLVFGCLLGGGLFIFRPLALVVTVVGHFVWSMVAFAALQDLLTIARLQEEFEERRRRMAMMVINGANSSSGSSSFRIASQQQIEAKNAVVKKRDDDLIA